MCHSITVRTIFEDKTIFIGLRTLSFRNKFKPVTHWHVQRTLPGSLFYNHYMGGSRGGGTGGPDPPEKSQKYVSFCNTGPEPLKNQASIQCWVIIGLPAKHHLNGVSLAGRWWPTFVRIWILFPSLTEKKTPEKKTAKNTVFIVLTLSFWIHACITNSLPNSLV